MFWPTQGRKADTLANDAHYENQQHHFTGELQRKTSGSKFQP